jgi:hypothetical protein
MDPLSIFMVALRMGTPNLFAVYKKHFPDLGSDFRFCPSPWAMDPINKIMTKRRKVLILISHFPFPIYKIL